MNSKLKLFSLGCLFMAFGCTNEIESPTMNVSTTIEAVALEVPASSQTRTAVDPTKYESGQIGVNWTPEDLIGVFGTKATNTPFENLSKTETSTTSFGGNLESGDKPVYAYYPYSPSAGSDVHAIKGSLADIQKYSLSSRNLDNDWKIGKPVSEAGDKFSFEHLFAFLHFEINAAGTALDGDKLESITLNIPDKQLWGDFVCNLETGETSMISADGHESITMEWIDTPQLSAKTFDGYLCCAPVSGIAGKSLNIVIKTTKHTATFNVECLADELLRNAYYTLPLSLSRFADSWQIETNPDTREDAAWVPALQSKLACANTVFAIPGKRFMHKVRVADSSMSVEAYNLPEGLEWNSRRKLVEGIVTNPGNYTYSIEVKNNDGTVAFSEGIRLTVSNDLIEPTPHMGWQSWNVLETNVDQASIMAVADALVSKGYKDAGYVWLGIDDCWQKLDGSRDSNGVPMVNSTKFPNGFNYLTDYIHAKGLKAGIYSDAGTLTCASGGQGGGTLLGAYGHEAAIAKAFTDWGFDKLKEDWFWSGHGDNNGSLDPNSTSLAYDLYSRMGSGIKNAGNKILLSMCEWGTHEPWKWGPEAGATSWRATYDARDGWMGQRGNGANSPSQNKDGIGLKNTIDLMRHLWPYVGINRFNDADMLCVGIRGKGTSSNDLVYGTKGMNDYEYETNFAMWCMWSSPLLITFDIRRDDINSHDVALLKNSELIAINQDPMAQGAEYIKSISNVDYYMKDLANGDVAIAAVNLGDNEASYNIKLEDYDALDASCSYKLRDVIKLADAGEFSVNVNKSGTLPAHATVVYRLSKK